MQACDSVPGRALIAPTARTLVPYTMSLLPPPPATYGTRDELLQAVKSWGAVNGYATTIARSFPKKGYVYIGCDIAGTIRNCHNITNETQRRLRGSRRRNCPFLVVGRCKDEVWTLRVRNGRHNHSATATDGHSSL